MGGLILDGGLPKNLPDGGSPPIPNISPLRETLLLHIKNVKNNFYTYNIRFRFHQNLGLKNKEKQARNADGSRRRPKKKIIIKKGGGQSRSCKNNNK